MEEYLDVFPNQSDVAQNAVKKKSLQREMSLLDLPAANQ
jgi:hypothetical protein